MVALAKLSRRRFVKCGACLFAFAWRMAKAQGRSPPLGGMESAVTAASDRDTSPIAAATDAASHLKVAVRIDGNGPYHFVIDTDADRTVLATEVADELGLFHGEKAKLQGVVRDVFADTVSIRTLAFE